MTQQPTLPLSNVLYPLVKIMFIYFFFQSTQVYLTIQGYLCGRMDIQTHRVPNQFSVIFYFGYFSSLITSTVVFQTCTAGIKITNLPVPPHRYQ